MHVSIEDYNPNVSAIRLLDETDDGVEVEVSALTLVIGPSDYVDGVMVTVRALQNEYSGDNPLATISHMSVGEVVVGPASLPVTVTDDEEPAVGVSVTMSASGGTEGSDIRGTEGSDILVGLRVRLIDIYGEVVMIEEGMTTEVTLEFSRGELV